MSVWLPVVVGAAFVWLVYRAGQWNEREGVIRGIEAELKMHEQWVGKPYGQDARGSWDPDWMVFKLSTVAIDNAIGRGPGLFLNRNLTVILVSYRQVVGHLNQLIDKATDFQVVAELWRNPRPEYQVTAAKQLVDSVHVVGIGDASGLQQKPAAHFFFKQVIEQLRIENDSRALRVVWAILALNLSFLRGWRAWLAPRLQSARGLAVSAWRRVTRVVAATPSPLPTADQPEPRLSTPPMPERQLASTAHEAHSFATVAPFDVENIMSANTSATPVSSTSSWQQQARLSVAPPLSSRAEPRVRRRRPKQDSARKSP